MQSKRDGKLPLFKMKCNETYRQIRKIPWLQSVQINFNNWILSTTKSYQLPVETEPTMGFSSSSPRSKKNSPQTLFLISAPPESQGAAFYDSVACRVFVGIPVHISAVYLSGNEGSLL